MKFSEYLNSLKGKRVAVVGAGISNTPLIESLLMAGINTAVCDRQTRDEISTEILRFEESGAELRLGKEYLENMDADIIFRTPGLMPSNHALREAVLSGALLTSEMEVFFKVCPCRIIAVTGSDGKTTTTSIISELLKKEGYTVHIGGNIGAPLLCRADDIGPEDLAVIELSSFQLITMGESPDIAVVTNVSPNHLDIHSSMDEYIGSKRNIFIHQKSSGRVVLNFDDEITRDFAGSAPGEALFFSLREKVRDGVYAYNGKIYESIDGHSEEIMPYCDISLPGMHNVGNYMAAFAAVRGLVSYYSMRETARTFSGVEHRIEFVDEIHGVRYYNDSIASSPTRAIAGLRSFNQKVILIAGGKGKGVGFDELGAEIVGHVKTLVLTGLTASMIRISVENAPDYEGSPEIIICEDFRDAVLYAAKSAGDGDIVLLSPACTSFDRFKNFEERGEFFKAIVRGMAIEN